MCQSPSINAHLHRTIGHKCIRCLNNKTISEMDAGEKKKQKTDSAALPFLYGIRNDFTLISFLDFIFNILSLKMIIGLEESVWI